MSEGARVWLHGLAAAAITSTASSLSTILVDPNEFNVTSIAGWRHVLAVSAVASVIGVALYLKASPLPPMRQVVQENSQTRDRDGNVTAESSKTKTITTTPGGV